MKLFFSAVEESELLFEIHGLRQDEIGILKISMDFYEKISRELPQKETEEPFNHIFDPPYVSLTKIELEDE